MDYEVTINVEFTSEAQAYLKVEDAPPFGGPPDINLLPAKGDIVMLPEFEGINFVVVGRVFLFKGDAGLTISYVLDIPPESKPKRRARPH